jgi:RNA polymerase sigma-70 factor (ECF subfamily)
MPPEVPEQDIARLYDSFGASLFRYALMILANREAAEDVIQQVFLAILGGARPIEDEERYLRRAVRNACYSALRYEKLRRPDHDALLEPVPGAPGSSLEERLALAAAIQQLPPEQREVIHLHVFEGRTLKDVGETTGESINTVASRFRYALEKLRAALTAERR